MTILNRLIALLALSKVRSSHSILLDRLLINIAAVAMLLITASTVLVLILCTLLWMGYTQLVESGMSSEAAFLLAEAVLIAFFGFLLWATSHYLCKMKNSIVPSPVAMGGPVTNAVNAFIDGLMTKQTQR